MTLNGSTRLPFSAAAACLAVFTTAAGSTSMDRWPPFADRRDASTSGQRYVLVHEAKQRGIRYELCERGRGEPPAKSANESDVKAGRADGLAVGAKDRVIAAGQINKLPYDVRVFDKSGGFVLFDTYYTLGKGHVVSYVNDAGEVVLEKSLKDLFGGVPDGAKRTVSSIWWSKGWFLDDRRGSIVVVAVGDQIREIAIKDGAITTPSLPTMLTWLRHGTEASRSMIFDAIAEQPSEDLKVACSTVVGIAHDNKQPLGLRLRAVVVLARAGDPADLEALFLQSVEPDVPPDERSYAIAHLPVILGDRAMPALRTALRAPDAVPWIAGQDGWVGLGEVAVPELCRMLLNRKESAQFRRGAAAALERLGFKAAVDPLLKAASDPEESVANSAVNAVIQIAPANLEERLIELFVAGSTQDSRLALHFKTKPSRRAIPGLRAAQARPGLGQTDVRWIKQAIAACEALPPVPAASQPIRK